MNVKTVSIVNVTSYTGVELLRLLAHHPEFVVTSVSARSSTGKKLEEIFPQLRVLSMPSRTADSIAVDPTLVITEEPGTTDLSFVCLPHAAAAEAVVHLLEQGIKVVDLSADFRLHDAEEYARWYNHAHPAPALLETAIYGLCEFYRERIEQARLVANPGCYATASILALIPAFAECIIEPDIIIDAKSGVSGAGRTLSLNTHYAEVNEDVSAYSLSGHRHLPEITQELVLAAKDGGHGLQQPPRITFIPHMMPMTRGILATCYGTLRPDAAKLTTADVQKLYVDYYGREPFVRVVDQSPHTKWTYGNNFCFIHPFVDAPTGRLVVLSCLDNLVKGAAGQAIQNANRMYGLAEMAGLEMVAVYP
jgi:N-acetyl-gamma-glutamyl-phosphate reductase